MKKFSKKLTLNKKTVANLEAESMDAAKGGYPPSGIDGASCPTWCTVCASKYFYNCPSVAGVDPRCGGGDTDTTFLP